MRSAMRRRETRETIVEVSLNLDQRGVPMISTGVRMLDHLLEQFSFHAGCSIAIDASSLDALQHHVVEDTAITFGEAISAALDARADIVRFGEATIPMDDALVRAVVDLGGRSYARIELPFSVERIEDLGTSLIPHFFSSLASNARIAIHIDRLAGSDPHHCVEAAFKALARACATAWSIAPVGIPSTKGIV